MLADLKLLLPALAPSWRFFDSVGPSLRLEYALLHRPQDEPDWREIRPRPARLSAFPMLRRLVWNPDAAERLFLTSCAERWLEAPTERNRLEILARIAPGAAPWRRWRIVQVRREGDRLVREVAYVSPAERASA